MQGQSGSQSSTRTARFQTTTSAGGFGNQSHPSRVDELVSWANDIKEYALQQAISGKEWTGWKLVEGRSNRRYTNEDAVSKAVEAAGFDPYEKKLLGITAMQKLLGKSRFEELLAAYIEKPQGKPTLVPENDKRPAMNTAKNDFMEEYDNE